MRNKAYNRFVRGIKISDLQNYLFSINILTLLNLFETKHTIVVFDSLF